MAPAAVRFKATASQNHLSADAGFHLLSQRSRLCNPTFAVLQRKLVDGTVILLPQAQLWPSVRGPARETQPENFRDFYFCDKGELPPPPRSSSIHLKTKPDNTRSFVEGPTFSSRPLKAD